MKVWVVTGDDRDYDMGSFWIVGIYATEELGDAAAKEAEEQYIKERGPNPYLSIDNHWMEVQS